MENVSTITISLSSYGLQKAGSKCLRLFNLAMNCNNSMIRSWLRTIRQYFCVFCQGPQAAFSVVPLINAVRTNCPPPPPPPPITYHDMDVETTHPSLKDITVYGGDDGRR